MRSPLLQFVIDIILLGVVRRYWGACGFGFTGLTPAPVVPLSVAANLPSPLAFPSPFPAAPYPFAPAPPVYFLAPSYGPAPFNCFPPPYPAYAPPPPCGLPPYGAYPPQYGLASTLLNAILAKKGKLFGPQYPYPPPPYPYPHPHKYPRHPEKHVLNVHITKDSGDEKKHHEHNHWHDGPPKWD